MACHCAIVPPHLLESIANSENNTEDIRKKVKASLDHHHRLAAVRKERLSSLFQQQCSNLSPQHLRPFVPQHLLQHLAESPDVDEKTRASAARDLALAAAPAAISQLAEAVPSQETAPPVSSISTAQVTATTPTTFRVKEAPYRFVYHAHNTDSYASLPGLLVLSEGQGKVADGVFNEAFDNVGLALQFFKEIFGWKSMDDQNMDVISSVHVGQGLQNAYWDGNQMLFGDGGDFLYNFTSCLDVIAHELFHGVTQYTIGLHYDSQSGALNEHLSDVFGVMTKQRVENVTVDKADWLIGEGCLFPKVKGIALRSMKEPGSAYNDPTTGKDPQVSNFADFYVTTDDDGGVHRFSGIPNKAFYLTAMALGGYSWEKAGQIWWKAVRSGQISRASTFLQFADVTVDCAKAVGGDETAKIVRQAWNDVGVQRDI